ncbi:hypothetical protein BJ508DRAFT_303090 [Ascobolus immersus RN42]|uniref:Uncharacterized protein n=1 Tax=Ascobolus immersus RN42 TaxID=1160509 RepID=A0A3N4IFV5_ASCIM|nr:hypothetical protein BJ508DRAFT_303090 [Ascobolus immersus RN42]
MLKGSAGIVPDHLEKLFLDQDIWTAIGLDQVRFKAPYPTSFGEFVNIDTKWRSLKAANWYTWAVQQALIYLSNTLATKEEFPVIKKVVFAVKLASRQVLSWEEVGILEVLIDDSTEYFEMHVHSIIVCGYASLHTTSADMFETVSVNMDQCPHKGSSKWSRNVAC